MVSRAPITYFKEISQSKDFDKERVNLRKEKKIPSRSLGFRHSNHFSTLFAPVLYYRLDNTWFPNRKISPGPQQPRTGKEPFS